MKIPLVPHQPPPATGSDEKTSGGGGGKKKDKGSTEDTIPQPQLEDTAGLELDQQLVVHTYNTALTAISSLVGYSSITKIPPYLHPLFLQGIHNYIKMQRFHLN